MRGGAELVFSRLGDRTVLSKSCSVLPLQVQRPIPGPNGEAIVTLLCPTGDLLEGDEVRLEVICEPETDVVLRQASATRLHICEQGEISLTGCFDVGERSHLRYLPCELIPFAGTNYRQHLQVNLDRGAEAVLWEVVGPGRLWEVEAPRRLSLETDVRVQGEVAFTDVLRIDGPNTAALAGQTHVGSLLIFGPQESQADADRIHCDLHVSGLIGSASLLPTYGVGARALANSADSLLRVFGTIVG